MFRVEHGDVHGCELLRLRGKLRQRLEGYRVTRLPVAFRHTERTLLDLDTVLGERTRSEVQDYVLVGIELKRLLYARLDERRIGIHPFLVFPVPGE